MVSYADLSTDYSKFPELSIERSCVKHDKGYSDMVATQAESLNKDIQKFIERGNDADMEYENEAGGRMVRAFKEQYGIDGIARIQNKKGESKLIKNQVDTDLKILIEKLPAEQKEVIMLRFYSEMSFKEIADMTGVSVNTTLGRMRYAMANMRKLIEKNKIYLPA